jgi:hypothetical protein
MVPPGIRPRPFDRLQTGDRSMLFKLRSEAPPQPGLDSLVGGVAGGQHGIVIGVEGEVRACLHRETEATGQWLRDGATPVTEKLVPSTVATVSSRELLSVS